MLGNQSLRCQVSLQLEAFLIFGWRTECDQPSEQGIMLKDLNPRLQDHAKDKTNDVTQRLFITKQAYFLYLELIALNNNNQLCSLQFSTIK